MSKKKKKPKPQTKKKGSKKGVVNAFESGNFSLSNTLEHSKGF
jgi:hypothetical protein